MLLIATLLLVAVSLFRDFLGMGIVGHGYSGNDVWITLIVAFTQYLVPFVFGGIGAGLILNSIINGKPITDMPAQKQDTSHGSPKESQPVAIIKVHFFYVVTILSCLIIYLMVVNWTPQPDFTEYLGNVATMVSLVLALVAIVYSFVANDGLTKSLGNLTAISDSLGDSKAQLKGFVEKAEVLSQENALTAKDVRSASANVQTEVLDLKKVLEKIEKGTSALNEIVASIPQRMDGIDSKLEEQAKKSSTEQKKRPSTGNFSTQQVFDFLENTSITSNVFVYAFYLAFKSSKKIEMKDVAKLIGSNSSYFLGLMSALSGFGVITVTRHMPFLYTVDDMDDELSELIEQYVKDVIDDRLSESAAVTWRDRVSELKKYFEI